MIVTNVDTSSRQKKTKIEYKVDAGTDSSLMPLNVFEILFPIATVEQLIKHKDKSVMLCTYNKTCIPQLGVCSVNIKHKNKQKLCRFFVVPVGSPALLGMPDIEALVILSMSAAQQNQTTRKDQEWAKHARQDLC